MKLKRKISKSLSYKFFLFIIEIYHEIKSSYHTLKKLITSPNRVYMYINSNKIRSDYY